MNLATVRHIYFLGIGGIGMSALAHYFLQQGKKVSGYDRTRTLVTDALVAAGAEVFFTQDPAHLTGKDLVIFTPAIPVDAPERVAAQQLGLPMMKRAAVLGSISKEKKTIAVGGTHGKTTTSSMATHLLRTAGVDVTAFLGGISRNLGGNFAIGSSDWCVAEADEFDRSFLHLFPEIALITSTDADHLDIYGSASEVLEGYRAFASQCRKLLLPVELNDGQWPLSPATYGLGAGDFQANNLRQEGPVTRFDFFGPDIVLNDLELHVPGKHNVLNMTAALALSLLAGANPDQLAKAVASFSGIYRRFEIHLNHPELAYVDDYAHHPTEIRAALEGARSAFPARQVVTVFQPHLFTRTRDFAGGFREALSGSDAVLMMDIYPAREIAIEGVTGSWLLEGIHADTAMMAEKGRLPALLDQVVSLPAVVLTLGAGDIDQEVESVKNWANSRIASLSAAGFQAKEKP